MKKWLFIVAGLILILVSVQLYPLAKIMVAKEPRPPVQITSMDAMEQLRAKKARKEPLSYLVLGDSVAKGLGADRFPHGYSSFVVDELKSDHIPLQLKNKGIIGQTSQELYHSLGTGTLDGELRKADLISLTIGGNDVLKVALEEQNPFTVLSNFEKIETAYRENLAGILGKIRQENPNAPIYLTSLYNPIDAKAPYFSLSNKFLKKWNISLKEIAYQYKDIQVVEVEKRLPAGNKGWLSDEIHPNDYGYQLIAEGIVEEIRHSSTTSALLD